MLYEFTAKVIADVAWDVADAEGVRLSNPTQRRDEIPWGGDGLSVEVKLGVLTV